tara:strand:- start:140 stop:523 length:384 start_codon:yes stop_codon:yes gene_type:complete
MTRAIPSKRYHRAKECGEQAKKETWIKAIIATGLSERDEVLEVDWTVDYDVYRDGKNDGVCYEYIAREYKEFDNDELKALLISLVRTLTLEDSILNTALESGIYLRFIYKTQGGQIFGDQIITYSDL